MMPGEPAAQSRRAIGARGYSLLEITIVLLIVSILLGIALPSYERYSQRSHRMEAIQKLLSGAGCQARIHAQTGFYDTTRCLGDSASRYALTAQPHDTDTATGYLLIATPLGGQQNDTCGALTLEDIGTRGASGSAADVRACWKGR